jgi:AcrR family transcriptional regulator
MISPASGNAVDPASERSERRRRQVLDAAEICFRRHGFHGASMAGVAAEAGMSVGHIYRYFENKEAIIAAFVERDLRDTVEQFARMREAPVGAVEAMVEGLEECVDQVANKQSASVYLEVMAEAARNPKIAEMATAHYNLTRSLLMNLFASGRGAELSESQIEDLTDLLQLFIAGLRVRAIHDPDIDRDRMARLMQKIVTAAPKPEEG